MCHDDADLVGVSGLPYRMEPLRSSSVHIFACYPTRAYLKALELAGFILS